MVISYLDELKPKNKDLEQVKAVMLFHHLPRLYRNIYTRVSADRIQQLLKAAPGAKAEDYGFTADPSDKKYFVVDRFFDEEKLLQS